MKTKWKILGLIYVLVASFMFFGCSSGSTGTTTTTSSTSSTSGTATTTTNTSSTTTPPLQDYGMIIGSVKNSIGVAISSVTVTANASSGATNSEGWFSLANLPSSTREVVTFSKTGYISVQKLYPVTTGEATYAAVVMNAVNSAQTITATTGGTVMDVGATNLSASVTIAANSVVDSLGNLYTGTVNVTLTPQDPTVSLEAFPGNFEGIDLSGETVAFQSFGFLNITLSDASGNALNIASGSSMQMSMQVTAELAASAEATIPLWYFDTATSTWIQTGIATYDATSQRYVANISWPLAAASSAYAVPIIVFPSVWNFDKPFNIAYVTGRVIDSSGAVVQNAEVVCQGTGFRSSSYTGSDGTFRVRVPAGLSFEYYAQKSNQQSTSQTISSVLSVGEERAVGDITIPNAAQISITLSWGADPRDLDSHLTIPGSVEGHSRYHLYYLNRSYTATSSWPNVSLDTDDMDGYGPELVSIYRLYPGVYRYCVHDYAGDSDITNSGASVNLIISSGSFSGIYNFTPPTGAVGVNDVWRVFDVAVNASGNITAVSSVNDYLYGVSSSDHNYFSPDFATTEAGTVGGYGLMHIK